MKVINQALIVALEGCVERNERKRARISSRWSRARISRRRDFPLKLVFALIKINLLIAIKINNKFRVWIQMRTLSQYFFVFSRTFSEFLTLARSREALGYAFSMNIHWLYLPTLRWDSGCLQESVKRKVIEVIEPKAILFSVFAIRWIRRRLLFFMKLSIYSIIHSANWLINYLSN